jgi:hypothetical protein
MTTLPKSSNYSVLSPNNSACLANGRKKFSIGKANCETFTDYVTGRYQTCFTRSKKIGSFLLPMLELMPADRANAGGMAGHEFLKDTKGMENVDLGIPVGSKGEGIEGWATEIKKLR